MLDGINLGHLFAESQVGIRSINSEGREQGKKFGVEQYEMRTFSKDRDYLENLVIVSLPFST